MISWFRHFFDVRSAAGHRQTRAAARPTQAGDTWCRPSVIHRAKQTPSTTARPISCADIGPCRCAGAAARTGSAAGNIHRISSTSRMDLRMPSTGKCSSR
ncbi:hypothetical protein D3C72_2067110 [compost metagenome]